MSIKKPLGLGLVIGLLAMAFAAMPAIASAAPQLTIEKTGKSVAAGTTITATSSNATTVFPGLGTLKCKKVTVHGIVKTNSGTVVAVEMDGANDTATECELGTTKVEVKPTLTSINLTASSKVATFDFEGGGLKEEAKGATVSYTAPPCAKSVHIAGPVTGTASGSFTGDFTIETATTPPEPICVD